MTPMEIVQAIASKIVPIRKTTDRQISTPEEVRWQRQQADAIQRDAQMAGIDVDFERAGRQWTH